MKKAFSLVELIFVIVIIGILAAVAVPKFLTTVQNSKLKPMIEVGNQVLNKVTERYKNIQDPSIIAAIANSPQILDYLNKLTSDIDVHFDWDANDTDFIIKYNIEKTTPGSTGKGINNFNGKGKGPKVATTYIVGNTCLHISRWERQIPVTIDANVTQYDFNISELNLSCIEAAE